MSRANLDLFEANLLAILEAINELVHLELLTDVKFAAILNFYPLRNLASNELFLLNITNIVALFFIYQIPKI